MRVFDIALLVCLSLGSLAAAARIGLVPLTANNGIAVIFAPWTNAHDSMQRATDSGARFVRYGGAQFIAVVMPDASDYTTRMLDQGAWLVMDPEVLAACLGVTSASGMKS